MKFNVDKCVVMNVGNLKIKSKIVSGYDQEIQQSQITDNPVAPRRRAAQPSKYEYKMNKQILETVKHHLYLGVELTDNMKYNNHIGTTTSKASRVLGFVKRNLKHCPRTV